MQHRLYFLPEPHGHGSLRPMCDVRAVVCAGGTRSFAKVLYAAKTSR
ncbi:MAG: hypothetical protein NT062_29665 [Proteobacteria bacterium]|nr:hypothetical protein [Pseudomonadota bacterium]